MKEIRKEVDRRSFIRVGALAGATAFALGTRDVLASEELTLSSATIGKCGTCEFWGGARKVATDGKSVTFESPVALGWCNNPESPNYYKRTSPQLGPMPTWRKWSILR